LNRYEGMLIFPESIADDALDEAVGRAKAEIEKLGGTISGATRMGRREFARPMAKQRGGHYVVIRFELDGGRLPRLTERYTLAGEVFRAQFTCAAEDAPIAPPPAAEEEKKDGVAE